MTYREEGYKFQGPRHMCPYLQGSKAQQEWAGGWLARYYGEPL